MRVGSMRCLFLLFVFCLAGQLLWGQGSTNTGTVAGTVTDPSGAVVSGATVTLTDVAIGTPRTATTNNAGHYLFPDVNPGGYTITINKQGFATTKAPNLQVLVGQATTFNTALQVGGTAVEVEVSAAGTELQTMNATVGNTITSVAIDNLPSLGRDVSTFVELQPGVAPDGSVAGAVNDQSYFSLDGGNNSNDMDGSMAVYTTSFAGDPTGVAGQMTAANGPTGVIPTPQDSVEEFKVNTTGQTADFNSSAGAEVKVVTKRGTNAWHGTAYDYYRSNNWSANTWANNYNNALSPGSGDLPAFHYSRFGGAIGGPIIPKDILGGKTYFFGNFEGFRWPQAETIFRDVPSPAMRLGLLEDPTTLKFYNLNPTAVTYKGVTYPGTTNDPRGLGLNPLVSQVWSKYVPQSNATCSNSLCDGFNILGYSADLSIPQSSNFAVARMDHDFSKNWHLMTSYRYFNLKNTVDSQVDIGGFFPGDTLGTPAAQSGDPQEAWFFVAGLTTNITSNTTNDFHYSYLRNWWSWNRAGDTVQLPGLGGALEIANGESQTQNLAPYNVNTQQTRTRFWDGHDNMIRDDISMLKGNHLFQFGGQYQRNWDWHQRTDNGGGINYQPVYQLGQGAKGAGDISVPFCGTVSANFQVPCGADYAAILGMVSVSQTAFTRSGPNLTLNPPLTPAFDQSTIPYYNVYFSDTWHMKPTFTFTYGLGYTLEMPPTEAQGKQVELVDTADQPVSAEAYLKARERAADLGQVYNPIVGFALTGNTANGLKYPYNPFYGEFSPRVAVAWNPHFDVDSMAGKIFGHEDSVIRAGYGRVYGRLNGVDLVLVPLLGTGLLQPVQCFDNLKNGTCGGTGSATALNAFRVGTDGLTAPLPIPSKTLVQPDYPGVNAIAAGAGEALDPNFRPNVVDSFDLTIQRQLARKMTLEIGYIGRRITHEYQPINLNAPPTMMVMGGQPFSAAYRNLEIALGCAAGPNCATAIPTNLTPQPFFEAALAGTGYCTGFTSCTQAVATKEQKNLGVQQVWSMWSDLDQGGIGGGPGGTTVPGFNFVRSMENSPINTSPFGGSGQLSSGVAVNASVGYGNYNAGFVSLKMNDYKGLTLQQNFTYSKALGTGALVQATSEYTPDDPYNLSTMYGRQVFDRKFVYNLFMVYQPPFFKGQSGVLGRILGGWSFAPVFTAGSGEPIEVGDLNGNSQAFGAGDGSAYFDNENAIPIAPIQSGHAYYNTPGSAGVGTGGLPINIFKNPATAFADFRNPILGLDQRDGGFGILGGLPYWNMDFSIRKNIRVAESVSLEFQGVFTNILNHNQMLDPAGLSLGAPGTFGNLVDTNINGVSAEPRAIELGARIRF